MDNQPPIAKLLVASNRCWSVTGGRRLLAFICIDPPAAQWEIACRSDTNGRTGRAFRVVRRAIYMSLGGNIGGLLSRDRVLSTQIGFDKQRITVSAPIVGRIATVSHRSSDDQNNWNENWLARFCHWSPVIIIEKSAADSLQALSPPTH